MIVCVCERVSDKDIERHVRNGCDSFDSLQRQTGVATCCGRCDDCAREVFESAAAVQRPHGGGGMRVIPLVVANGAVPRLAA